MSYMTEAPRAGAIADFAEDAGQASRARPMLMDFRIKCLGQRPLQFRGQELGMAMSFAPDLPYWYEINLFRTVDRSFVLTVKQFFQSADERDTVRAWTFTSLDDAIDKIESYDAADDLRVALPRPGGQTAVDLAASALEFRAQAEAARNHFKGLVGEFLYELDEAV
jgi:hypothetical protein